VGGCCEETVTTLLWVKVKSFSRRSMTNLHMWGEMFVPVSPQLASYWCALWPVKRWRWHCANKLSTTLLLSQYLFKCLHFSRQLSKPFMLSSALLHWCSLCGFLVVVIFSLQCYDVVQIMNNYKRNFKDPWIDHFNFLKSLLRSNLLFHLPVDLFFFF